LLDGVLVIMIVGKRQHHHLHLSSRLLDFSRVVPASIKLFIASTARTQFGQWYPLSIEGKQVRNGQVDALWSSSVNNKAYNI